MQISDNPNDHRVNEFKEQPAWERSSITKGTYQIKKNANYPKIICVFVCRGDRIRTCDPLVPNQMRYRPALLPERLILLSITFEKRTSGEGGIRTPGTV